MKAQSAPPLRSPYPMKFISVFLFAVVITSTMCAAPSSVSPSFPVLRPKNTVVFIASLAELNERQAAVYRLAAKYHLPVIRYQEAFDAACRRAPADHWSWDGVHPHYAGHSLMAGAWMETVSAMR
jgi:lysophospholipase L1-like esterase